MHKFCLKIGNLRLFLETTLENPKTIEEVLKHFPIKGEALRWGEEIYFFVPFSLPREHGRQECELGEIGFWLEGPGIAIFFGKTPASKGSKPRAYSPCNFFAKIVGSIGKDALSTVREGEKILLEKAKQA